MADDNVETTEMNRVERENKEKFYEKVVDIGNAELTHYQTAYRNLYYMEGVLNAKKSRELLEKILQQVHPSLHYS